MGTHKEGEGGAAFGGGGEKSLVDHIERNTNDRPFRGWRGNSWSGGNNSIPRIQPSTLRRSVMFPTFHWLHDVSVFSNQQR